jgi:hypothetical protein
MRHGWLFQRLKKNWSLRIIIPNMVANEQTPTIFLPVGFSGVP